MGAKVKPATLLYVSNDQFSLATLKVLLESRGYCVLLARTCRYAWQLLDSTHFDAVVFDSDMGEHVTNEMTIAIKGHSAATPILLLASHRYSQVCTISCDAFCAKLDGNEALLFKLAALLSDASQQQATGAKQPSVRADVKFIRSRRRLLEVS